MTALERAALLAYSRTPAHRRRVAAAQRTLHDFFQRVRMPLIALSGGKDSTVILDLSRRMQADMPAMWMDDDVFVLPETRAYLARIPALKRIAVTKPIAQVQGKEMLLWPDSSRVPAGTHWVDGRLLPRPRYEPWIRQSGHEGTVVGLRADENSTRRIFLAQSGGVHRKRNGYVSAYPIRHWTDRDVWAYIVAHRLPYNAAYDRMRAHDIPPARQRVGACFKPEAIRGGAIEVMERVWPDVWAVIVRAYPDMPRWALAPRE